MPEARPAAQREVRYCASCLAKGRKTVLSRYSRGDICMACEDAKLAAEAEREMEKTQAAFKAAETRERRRGVEVAGVRLAPVDRLPGRINGANRVGKWEEVIQGFVASNIAVAKVEGHGLKNASSVYAALREAIGDDKRCYPVTRRGDCYLVRVKK